MKLFFEAGTVGAADEHIAALRTSRGDAQGRTPRKAELSTADVPTADVRAADVPTADVRAADVRANAAPKESGRHMAAQTSSAGRAMALPAEVRIVEAPHGVRLRDAAPVKPVILEWDEWTLAFQQEPVIIDAPQVADDEMTMPDLSAVRTVPDVTAEAPPLPEKPQGKPARNLRQQLRIPHEVPRSAGGVPRGTDRSFIDGTKRTL